jgi:D-alanyl-D-alanine carboxypeptidase
MERRIRTTGQRALGFVALALILLPAVNNITPAKATSTAAQSLTDPESRWIVVNKQRPLNPVQYVPKDLVAPRFDALNANPYGLKLRKEASTASYRLAMAMKSEGAGSMVIQSGYRSFAEQKVIYDRQVARYGLKAGEALAARAGHSEHQTGWALDVSARGQGCQIRVCFGKTKAGSWLIANAHKHGFIIRYPEFATPVTGYQYEPWHLRYVGKPLAKAMHDSKISTLEKYFSLPSAPNY